MAITDVDELDWWELCLLASSEVVSEKLEPFGVELFARPQLGLGDDLGNGDPPGACVVHWPLVFGPCRKTGFSHHLPSWPG